MKSCYLAGPIGGCSYKECTEWREKVTQVLFSFGIRGISPMRGKEFLSKETFIDQQEYTDPMAKPMGITTRDRFDVQASDVVLMNLLDVERNYSVGTCIEIGWADAWRKPLIIATPEERKYAKHPMVKSIAGFIVPDLVQAVRTVITILCSESLNQTDDNYIMSILGNIGQC